MSSSQTLTQAVIYLVIIALFLRRTLTTQTMRVVALPVIGILYVAIAAFAIFYTPKSSAEWIAIPVGVVLGVVLGYLRGRHSTVTPGPRPGTIRVKASPVLAAIVILALILRLGVRTLLPTLGDATFAISDGAIAFAALSVAVARLMLYFTARRMIAPAV